MGDVRVAGPTLRMTVTSAGMLLLRGLLCIHCKWWILPSFVLRCEAPTRICHRSHQCGQIFCWFEVCIGFSACFRHCECWPASIVCQWSGHRLLLWSNQSCSDCCWLWNRWHRLFQNPKLMGNQLG